MNRIPFLNLLQSHLQRSVSCLIGDLSDEGEAYCTENGTV